MNYRYTAGTFLLCTLALTAACSDDFAERPSATPEARVEFRLSTPALDPATRIAPLPVTALSPDADAEQVLALEGDHLEGACLLEATTPTPSTFATRVATPIATRAEVITTETLGQFSTIAYRGTTATDISTSPWFYNAATTASGTLVNPVLWDFNAPYAKFYAVYPEATATYTKLALSPESHVGTPYVDFEVEPQVRQQKDLLTAYTGVVHYATQGTAPEARLAFYHALTAVRFKIGELARHRVITKVEITNALGQGRYTLPTATDGTGATWTPSTTRATYTLDNLNVETARYTNQLFAGTEYTNTTFYMLPQTLTGQGVKAKIYFKDGGTWTSTLTGQWLPGTTKTYTLTQVATDKSYTLTTSSPDMATYDATTSGAYTIESYRTATDGTKEAVAWSIVGYDANNDGVYTLDERPQWMAMNLTSGQGGTAPEAATATLVPDAIVDHGVQEATKALSEAEPRGTTANPYDLSTEGGIKARTTANSYLISAPGHYRLPLVYGNAVTNGQNNPNSYSTSVSGSYVLQHFFDHNGVDITDPWITQTNNGANTPNGTKLVWSSGAGLVTGLTLAGTGTEAYLDFEVPQAAIKNGNAVIAVTKDGVVVWSWQLWFAPEDALKTIALTNQNGKTFHMGREPLGYTYTSWLGSATYFTPRSVRVKVEQAEAGTSGKKLVSYITISQDVYHDRRGYGTFYQWGRKDPIPAKDDYVVEGEWSKFYLAYTTATNHDERIRSYIKNPGVIHCAKGNLMYCNLWSANANYQRGNALTANLPADVKTIYDPSPAGFKVPYPHSMMMMTSTGARATNTAYMNKKGNWEQGYTFYNRVTDPDDSFFVPAFGRRLHENGIINLTTSGLYWSSIKVDLTDGNNAAIQIEQNHVFPLSYYYSGHCLGMLIMKDE